MTSIDYGAIIQQLGPVNNRFRDAEGVEKIAALWEMGDVLNRHLSNQKSLDSVFWEIHKRSYITRDLLRYATIVRGEWRTMDEVYSLFSGVKRYSLFREALPFLKGERQGVDQRVFEGVLSTIKSENVADAKESLRLLKERYIGKANKKGVSKIKVAPDSQLVKDFIMRSLPSWIGDKSTCVAFREDFGDKGLQKLSQTFYGLAVDRLIPPLDLTVKGGNAEFYAAITRIANGNREQKSAFKKLIGALTLMEWADLFNAMRSDEEMEEWKERTKLTIKVR